MSELFDEAKRRAAKTGKSGNKWMREQWRSQSEYASHDTIGLTSNIKEAKKNIDTILSQILPIINELMQRGVKVEISKLIDEVYVPSSSGDPKYLALGFGKIVEDYTPGDNEGSIGTTAYRIHNVNALTVKLWLDEYTKVHNKPILKVIFTPLPKHANASKNSFDLSLQTIQDIAKDFSKGALSGETHADIETCVAKFRNAVIEAIRVYILH